MKYIKLVNIYKKLETTSKRLEKTYIISEFIKEVQDTDISQILLLLQGKLFPPWDERKIGVAARIILKAIQVATGSNIKTIENTWKNTGDLGITAKMLISTKKQATLFSESLNVNKVVSNLQKICIMEGLGTVDRKVKLIAELLTSANPNEAQYIVRTVLEDLRVGVGDGSMRDAIVWANFSEKLGIQYDIKTNKLTVPDNNRTEYNQYIEQIQEAYDLTSDFGKITQIIKDKGLIGLKELNLEVGKPVKVMLVQKSKDPMDAFEKLGRPCAFEFKYDGFRLQIHKKGENIQLFTRNLENVTAQFPDVVEIVKEHISADSIILDTETVGYDKITGKYLPFQSVSQRIKRKHNIEDIANRFPVEVNIFDVLFLNGENKLKILLKDRRKLLEKIIKPVEGKLVISNLLITEDLKIAEEYYQKALDKGNEGLIGKNLDSVYKPGSRVGFWVKIKPVMESLELVIVGAEWGEGKRANWLTSFTLAARNKDNNLFEIGKISTGLKELSSEGTSYEDMTNILKPLIIAEKGKTVKIKPRIVIEVNFEEIQKSPTYSSGYALRFPRFIRLREDRSMIDIDNLDNIEDLYLNQRNRAQ